MSLDAFLACDFRWTRQLPSIWLEGPQSAQSLNQEVLQEILDDFERIGDEPTLGHVVVGTAGAGKTHLMGSLRREVVTRKQWFVLLDFAGIADFWRSTALGFLNSLQQTGASGKPQYQQCLQLLVARRSAFEPFRAKVRQAQAANPTPEQRADLVETFIAGLKEQFGFAAAGSHEAVLRAYMQLLVGDTDARNHAYAWLQGLELESPALTALGLPRVVSPRQLVAGALWMLSTVGRTLIAVDQIDAIVTEQNLTRPETSTGGEIQDRVRSIVQAMAGGLMELYDLPGRAKTVVACLEATWHVLKSEVTMPVTDRFYEPVLLKAIASDEAARRIVRSRLEAGYATRGFQPAYPTWPFKPEAFSTTRGMLPRQLLRRCEEHRLACRSQRAATELHSFMAEPNRGADPPPPADRLQALYDAVLRSADIAGLLDESREEAFKTLLAQALASYADHLDTGPDVDVSVTTDKDLKRPSLHARLVFGYRAQGDRERHFCYRLIPQANAVAFQARLRAAMTASGLDRALPFRHLVIVRNGMPPGGPKTAELVRQFEEAGGLFLCPSEEELRRLSAIVALRDEPEAEAWLRTRQAFAALELLRRPGVHEALQIEGPVACTPVRPPEMASTGAAPAPGSAAGNVHHERPGPATPSAPGASVGTSVGTATHPRSPRDGAPKGTYTDQISLGRRLEGGTEGREERLPIALLPRHVAVLAGAGAGKTVLLRRLVEEAVLRGIPAIVLDSNNDLSTLGERWPAAPKGWASDDAARAEAYLRRAEVVIWTPGLTKARPITLDVLPDFGALTEHDELHQGIDMALSALSSLVKLTDIKRGVLADALRAFAARGGGNIETLADFLADLPTDASRIGRAAKLAADTADQLRAAIATNPLLRSGGPALDPMELFTCPDRSRTRISVISFVGLASDESRQEFVNRLQMSLFGWIKRVPSTTPRLYVIDEARSFVPSQKAAASKESAVSLVAQARKYGLGVVVATQSPRDIDNKVISNCTTHFYGKMSSPAAIDAIRELIASRGGSANDIGSLTSGTFYFSSEGTAVPSKIRTAMCLSHHRASPPSVDDVVARASSVQDERYRAT